MGMFIDGKWHIQDVNPKTKTGKFDRLPTTIRQIISPTSNFKPETNRYHLVVSYACPWAHRTLIFRKIKALESHIPIAVVHPTWDQMAGIFQKGECTSAIVVDFFKLGDIYLAHDSLFTGRVTVPVLWDAKTHQIVNNESSDIIRMFNSAFNSLTKNELNLYPAELRSKIDEWNKKYMNPSIMGYIKLDLHGLNRYMTMKSPFYLMHLMN